MALLDLAHNVALLIALMVLHRIVARRWTASDVRGQVVAGVLFGGVGLLGMISPIHFFAPGIFLDARSIVLTVAGLFGGPLPAAIASAVCVAYRLHLGGAGMWIGVAVTLEAAALGVVFGALRRRLPRVVEPLPLFGIGVLVHGLMLALMLLLPDGAGIEVVERLGSVILLVYPLATVVVGRIAVDGEERMAATQGLAETRDRLRYAMEATADGLWDWDLVTGRVHYSPGYFAMLGYEPDGFAPDAEEWRSRLHPDDREATLAVVQACIDGASERIEAEFRMRTRDERWIWILARGRAVARGPDGGALRLVGTHVDIDDRKRLEEAQITLARGGLGAPGPDFFGALAQYLARSLRMDYVVISRLANEETEARSIAVCAEGVVGGVFNYALEGTPCGITARRTVCSRGSGIQEDFPDDAALRELGAHSYVGALLCDAAGRPIGVIAALGRSPRAHLDLEESILALAAERAGRELERMESEAALRDSEARLRAVIDAFPGMVHAVDRDLNVIAASQGLLNRMGLATLDEVLGRACHLAWCDSDRVCTDCAVRRVLETGAPITRRGEAVERAIAGTPVDSYVAPIVDATGAITGAVVLMVDVSERARAEAELQASEAKYRALFDSAADAIFVHDFEGRALAANPMALERYGYAESEIDLLTLSTLDVVEDAPLAPKRLARLRADGEIRFEGRHRHRDGTVIPVEVSARLIEWEGRPAAMTICRDVTERRRAERALAHSHDLMRYVIEHSSAGVAVFDRDLRYVYVSQRFLDEYRVGERDVIGRRHYDLFPEIPPEIREVHTRALAGEVVREDETPFARPDGAVDWTRWECRPWYEADGSVGGVVLYTEVITERKRAEADRARLEAQLQQTQRLESLGVLAGGVAHDFNNILAGVQGFTEMALDDIPAGSQTASFLQRALAGTARATELVRQILAFSRQAPMDERPIALHALVSDVLRFARATLPSTVEIDQELDSATPPVLADPTQIHQVVLNLCTNAEYAMRPRGGRLRVAVEPVQVGPEQAERLGPIAPGAYATVTVSDTGCGIDEATRARLFEPFFTTKPTGEGTGMGLATSHGIIARHGGAIEVESVPGAGATFRVYLPVSPESVQEPALERHTPVARLLERILVVDDEPSVLASTMARLRSLGYETVGAGSSSEALELTAEATPPFDLVLTDQTMPSMTGIDLAAALRARGVETPIVLATGFSPLVKPETLHRVGITELLPKPYTKQTLAEAVRRALDARPE